MRRILTIDGGGIKGAFPAAFLARLEEELGGPLVEHFDMIAGTSTGGIIAIGLGLGLSAKRLQRFYERHGREIFAGRGLWRELRGLVMSMYSNVPLRRVLDRRFQSRPLGDSRTRLLIPCLNVTQGKVHVYQTAHHPSLTEDWRVPAVEVAMASAAAPTFFPSFRSASGDIYIDGSLWARNPIGLATVQAVGLLRWPAHDIRILSLGCTAKGMNHAFGRAGRHGKSFWGNRIPDLFMKAHSSSALYTACTLVGREHVHRINPDPGEHHFAMDDARKVPALVAFGREQAEQHWPALKHVFFASKAPAFVPFHTAQTDHAAAAE